jgi:hypothetical protein
MDKKAYDAKIKEFNEQIKELKENAKNVKTETEKKAFDKQVDKLLDKKFEFEKKQLEEMRQQEKARLERSTNRVTAQLRKERNHRLYQIGGEIEAQLGKTEDPELFENILGFLNHRWFRNAFRQYLEREVNVKNEDPDTAEPEELQPEHGSAETKSFVNIPDLNNN